MHYVSMDLETTGLDPERHQILQMAMILEDTTRPEVPVEDLPTFCRYICHEEIVGSPEAIYMNAWLFAEMEGPHPARYTIVPPHIAFEQANDWLGEWRRHLASGRLTAAGKNVAGFDMRFLPSDLRSCFRHRVIDVGSVFVDWSQPCLPSLNELVIKTKIRTEQTHDALEDARDVIRLLRQTYWRTSLDK